MYSSEKSVLLPSVLLLVKFSVDGYKEKSSEPERSICELVLSGLNDVTPPIQFRLVFGEFGWLLDKTLPLKYKVIIH